MTCAQPLKAKMTPKKRDLLLEAVPSVRTIGRISVSGRYATDCNESVVCTVSWQWSRSLGQIGPPFEGMLLDVSISSERLTEIQEAAPASALPNLRKACRRRDLQNG